MIEDRTWQFASSSGPGMYTVWLRAADGRVSCDCRGWTTKRRDVRSCKHTDNVEAELKGAGLTFQVVGDAKHLVDNDDAVPRTAPSASQQGSAIPSPSRDRRDDVALLDKGAGGPEAADGAVLPARCSPRRWRPARRWRR